MRYSGVVFWLAAGWLAVANAQPHSNLEQHHWNNFKVNHGKIYKTLDEELYRQKIFVENLKKIEEHNKLFEEGKRTFTVRMNKFGELSHEEFKNKMQFYKSTSRNSLASVYSAPANEVLPSSVDWREKGAVTPVKNQGSCGSCWAFSTTGSIEGQTFIKTGKLVSLSEQNLVDCSDDYGNAGCTGGLMDYAFKYIIANGGIATEDAYPYEEKEGTCRFKKEIIGATISNYTDIKTFSESDLQSAVANVGPVSVGIDANEPSFQFYSSGIYYEPKCIQALITHGVLVVGYGSNKDGDFWIVKNSFGEDWGDNGYILMAKNKNNNCGIATKASYPIV